MKLIAHTITILTAALVVLLYIGFIERELLAAFLAGICLTILMHRVYSEYQLTKQENDHGKG